LSCKKELKPETLGSVLYGWTPEIMKQRQVQLLQAAEGTNI